jgi:hypothetical protein
LGGGIGPHPKSLSRGERDFEFCWMMWVGGDEVKPNGDPRGSDCIGESFLLGFVLGGDRLECG